MGTISTEDTIQTVINYIEKNIKEKITLEDIASNVYISKYHLHRVFKAITNKPIMEYVRNRKLACSVDELLNSKNKIVDIALEYKFEHEQSYIRSFNNLFGISPSKLRKEKKALKIVDKINLNSFKSMKQGIIIEPTFIIKPAFNLIGIREKIFYKDNRENATANILGKDFFYNLRNQIKNTKFPNIYIGFTTYSFNVTGEYSFYLPSIEVTDTKFVPEGMTVQNVPNFKYAVFKYMSLCSADNITLMDLIHTYHYIHEEWLPNSYYVKADNFHFERIDSELNKEDYCEIDIYIPVKERKN